ncbi:hypothetical protein MKK84_17450, partial [Methylobacterium sp. E-065]|nr:hypothetical protein [Methylobacterium sp. E-065]
MSREELIELVLRLQRPDKTSRRSLRSVAGGFEELIELVLRLQRPDKTSRTSSQPPATDRKERREQSKPGGAKPGHQGHSRVMSDDPHAVADHRPDRCACCRGALDGDLPSELVRVSQRIDLRRGPRRAPMQ